MTKFIELKDEKGSFCLVNINSISLVLEEGMPESMHEDYDKEKTIKSCSVIFIGNTEPKVFTNISYEELKELIYKQ